LTRWNLDDKSITINPVWRLGDSTTGYGDCENFTQLFAAKKTLLQ
jgi:hypothetical protein